MRDGVRITVRSEKNGEEENDSEEGDKKEIAKLLRGGVSPPS
jgi:hypothetical protein